MTQEHIDLVANIAKEIGLCHRHYTVSSGELHQYLYQNFDFVRIFGTTRQEVLAEIGAALKKWRKLVEDTRNEQVTAISELEGKLVKAMYPSQQDWAEYLKKLGLMNFVILGNAVCVTVEGCTANLFVGRTWTDGKDAIDKMLKDAVEKLESGAAAQKKLAERLGLLRDKNNAF